MVARVWGSEVELTKAAYERVNQDVESPITVDGYGNITTIKQLKDEIITLKLSGDDDATLKDLLGSFVNYVSTVKESMVIDAMNEMKEYALKEIRRKDDTANAKVMD